jgi:hypothetical protein
MIWSSQDEREILAAACRDNFWTFVMEAYGGYYNPRFSGWLDPAVHKPLCDWYSHHIHEWIGWRRDGVRQQKCLMVIVPREFGKTTLITQAGQLWLHLQDPDLATYTGSENFTRATEFLASVRSVAAGEDPYARFGQLFGSWRPNNKNVMWSNAGAVHAARRAVSRKEPSFGTWGVEKGLTGTHPDALFLDDPTSYEAMALATNWLDVVNGHLDSLLPVLTTDGLFVLPGTRYHDGDHFGRTLKSDGAKTVSGMPMPDYAPRPDGKWEVYFLQARDIEGTPTLTKVWPGWRLDEYERKNNLRYAAQVMNDPSSSEFNPLTRGQIDLLRVKPEEVPWSLRYSIHCDTAFKSQAKQARGDESVLQIWGHDLKNGDVYFIEGYCSNVWRAEDFNNKLVMVLQKLKSRKTWHERIVGRWPFVVTDEQEVGGKQGTWELTIASACHTSGLPAPPLVLLSRGGAKKINRIIEASAHWADGRVKLVEGAPGLERLVDQMSRIGSSASDDWSDAAADVFNPKVYNGAPRLGSDQDLQPEIHLPWDDVLKNNESAVKAYDAYHSREEPPYEPV